MQLPDELKLETPPRLPQPLGLPRELETPWRLPLETLGGLPEALPSDVSAHSSASQVATGKAIR